MDISTVEAQASDEGIHKEISQPKASLRRIIPPRATSQTSEVARSLRDESSSDRAKLGKEKEGWHGGSVDGKKKCTKRKGRRCLLQVVSLGETASS